MRPSFCCLTATIALLHPQILHPQSVLAQITPTQTTGVLPSGNQFNIIGGSFSSNGQNQFHNFSQFNLTASQIANFQSNSSIRNIFARITGDPSIINGLLQVSGGASNLFLINPSGILFGKDAKFNLPAGFTATTATDLKFGSQTWSLGTPANYAKLIGDPTQLTLHPTGSIVNSGNLVVNPGQSIALISSNVVNTGRISAPGGQITIAAVPGSQTVKLSHPNNLLSLEFQPIAPGQPIAATSLPQLLAGSNIQNATGLERTPDGKIQLIGSGLGVSNTPGLAGIAGTIDASVGGHLQILGQDILLASNALFVGNTYIPSSIPSGDISLTANTRIRTVPNLTLDWSAYLTTPIRMSAGQEITIGDTFAPGGLTLAAPTLTTGNLFTNGKSLSLTGGTIATGLLNSSPNPANPNTTGGNITISATGNITTRDINADATFLRLDPNGLYPLFTGTSGNINLSSTGKNSLIQTGGIRARGGKPGTIPSGNVSITGDNLQIGTGDALALETVTAIENQISINTTGTIFLSQRGGGQLPFQVGTAVTPNGTLGRLLANDVSLDQGLFPIEENPYRVSPVAGITIESLSTLPKPTPALLPTVPATTALPTSFPTALPTSFPTSFPTSVSQLTQLMANSRANLLNRPNPPRPPMPMMALLASKGKPGLFPGDLDAEQRLTAGFDNLIASGQYRSRSMTEARDITQQIEGTTGVKPALIYFTFVPTQTTLMSEAIAPTANDTLEITLVTAQGITRKLSTTVDRTQILAVAKALRQEVTNPLRTHTTSYLRPAQQLYRWLIAPLEAELKAQNIRNLVFLPDAGLRSLPYSALHDGKQFLLQNYSVSMMPSISLTDIRYRDIRTAKMLTIGISDSTQGQTPLPSVTTEITALQQLWSNSNTLQNQQATLDNLKSARTQYPYSIIHLATHGNFSSQANHNSYIQLWNEKLQLDQIRKLGWSNPPVELLVLSACKTAIGDRETELGFAGLAVQTGVKSTIASLWSVDDTATTALMINLYSHLKTSPIKAEALRQAQMALASGTTKIQDRQLMGIQNLTSTSAFKIADKVADKTFRHPYYWSAFTLIGNPW